MVPFIYNTVTLLCGIVCGGLPRASLVSPKKCSTCPTPACKKRLATSSMGRNRSGTHTPGGFEGGPVEGGREDCVTLVLDMDDDDEDEDEDKDVDVEEEEGIVQEKTIDKEWFPVT